MNSLAHGLNCLFEQISLSPVNSPNAYDCSGLHTLLSHFNLVWDAAATIRDRLHNAGFFSMPDMCLVVPKGSRIPLRCKFAFHIFEYEGGDTAYLFIAKIGNIPIILPPDGMTWFQWEYAIQKGERPSLIVTMPWAQAKFINWKKAVRNVKNSD